jgi:hypothetical protein
VAKKAGTAIRRYLEADSGGLTMKGRIRVPRKRQKIWVFTVCDRLASLIPSLLSFFAAMFCFVLFCIWCFPEMSWWLVALVVILSASMLGVAAIFAIGSGAIGLKKKSPRELKNKVNFFGETRTSFFACLEPRKETSD